MPKWVKQKGGDDAASRLKSYMDKEFASMKLWKWLVILAVLIVLIVVVMMIMRKREGATDGSEFSGDAEVDPDEPTVDFTATGKLEQSDHGVSAPVTVNSFLSFEGAEPVPVGNPDSDTLGIPKPK